MFFSPAVRGLDEVWLIGSGPDVFSAEVQIERNVQWAREVLGKQPGRRELQVYFTDGDSEFADVKLWQRPADSAETLQPLARIYDTFYANGYRYRNHQIEAVAGPTAAAFLKPHLREAIGALDAGDAALLFYLGHGGEGEAEQGGSYLNLWDHGRLDVREMRAYFNAAPADARLRFVFTQCYSGGFADLIYPDHDRRAQDITGQRCGFLSVSRDQPAEGCSANLDTGNYRGYSTYFLAALQGKTRGGDELRFPVDRNRDGLTSLYEAHLYTLRAARSTDLPRSTSEQFLLDWSPWYINLLAPEPRPDNPYRELARELAQDLELDLDPDRPRPVLHSARIPLRERLKELEDEQSRLSGIIRRARQSIAYALEQRWPAAGMAPTRAYKDFLQQDLEAAQAFILAHPLYPPLVEEQERYWTLDSAILELDRQLATLNRIEHLSRLARLRDAMHAWAPDDSLDAYRRLLACEDRPL